MFKEKIRIWISLTASYKKTLGIQMKKICITAKGKVEIMSINFLIEQGKLLAELEANSIVLVGVHIYFLKFSAAEVSVYLHNK